MCFIKITRYIFLFYFSFLLKTMTENNKSESSIRVIIVGDSSVGKTCLLLRQTEKKYFADSKTTTVASFLKSVIQISPKEHVNLDLIDTAGTEKYKSLSTLFFRHAQIALICFSSPDLNDDAIKSINQWKNDVLAVEPKCKLVLVGTKSDLLPLDKTEFLENISKLQKESDIKNIFITSSVTGEGVDALFNSVALMDKPLDHHNDDPTINERKNYCNC